MCVCVYIHTYIRTYIHTYMHTYIHHQDVDRTELISCGLEDGGGKRRLRHAAGECEGFAAARPDALDQFVRGLRTYLPSPTRAHSGGRAVPARCRTIACAVMWRWACWRTPARRTAARARMFLRPPQHAYIVDHHGRPVPREQLCRAGPDAATWRDTHGGGVSTWRSGGDPRFFASTHTHTLLTYHSCTLASRLRLFGHNTGEWLAQAHPHVCTGTPHRCALGPRAPAPVITATRPASMLETVRGFLLRPIFSCPIFPAHLSAQCSAWCLAGFWSPRRRCDHAWAGNGHADVCAPAARQRRSPPHGHAVQGGKLPSIRGAQES